MDLKCPSAYAVLILRLINCSFYRLAFFTSFTRVFKKMSFLNEIISFHKTFNWKRLSFFPVKNEHCDLKQKRLQNI